MITAPALRPARPAESSLLAGVLGRAYADDPMFRWLLGRSSAGVVARALAPIVRSCARRGSVTVAADYRTVMGVAVWAPWGTRGTTPLSLATMLGATIGRRGRNPLLRLVWSRASARRHPSAPHRYLVLLGTEPQHGSGRVRERLLEAGLVGCDARRLGAYTEVHSAEDADWLADFDFEVMTSRPLADGAPPTWSLWRDPR